MISDERLHQVARGDWKCDSRGMVEEIASELLALRKALSEPVGQVYFDSHYGWFAKLEHGNFRENAKIYLEPE